MNDSYLGFHIDWVEQWSQFLSFDDNWYTFNLSHIEFEWDRIMGGVEATVIILGLGFRARYNYAETEQVKNIKTAIKDLDDEGFFE